MWRKTTKNKGENQQQTQLIYAGFNSGVQTQGTLVGGEFSHQCSTLACRHAHCGGLSFVLPFLAVMGLQVK